MSTGIFDTVVKNGYCIGCGLCAAHSSNIRMRWSEQLYYQPEKIGELSIEEEKQMTALCPFSGKSENEDEIGSVLFKQSTKDQNLGYVSKCYAGYVKEGSFRKNGSSGGMGSWLVTQLLRRSLVDAVIHVGVSESNPSLFNYRISKTELEINQNSKSRYYPVTLEEIILKIKEEENGTKFAFVGIPCYVKSIRLACKHDLILADKIKFCIGLVCGHMKSGAFAEYLAWQVGIKPKDLEYIDFRRKRDQGKANAYSFSAVSKLNPSQEIVTPMFQVKGGDWGMGYFKLKACEFCDDVVAETADVVVGDAWLPKYDNDSSGTNLVITRNPIFDSLIEEGTKEDLLCMEEITTKDAFNSQKSGFRHRREGLAYRLYKAKKEGIWFPEKRTQPSAKGINHKRRSVYSLRSQISEHTHSAFLEAKRKDNIDLFTSEMQNLIKLYNQASSPSLARKTASYIKNKIFRILKRR